MLCRRNIILLCVTIYMIQVKCADKYTDENRPYEFGFTIDGEQHRHEKKDKNGIIMGEFGFITADGVYHVTVYATDENGNFKILSMKNIRVKPYPTAKSGAERGRSLEYSPTPQVPSKSSEPEQRKKQFKELPKPGPASPAKSCSHCKLPTTTTTTTQAPYIPSNNIPLVPAISQEPEIPPKHNIYEEYSQKVAGSQGYLQQGQKQEVKRVEQVHQQQSQPPQELQKQEGQQKIGQEQQQQTQQPQELLKQQGQKQVGQEQLQQSQQLQELQKQQRQQQQIQQAQGPQPLQQQEKQQTRLQQQGQQQVTLQQQAQSEQKLDQFNNEQIHSTHEFGSGQNYAQNNEGNYPQQSYTQEGLQSDDYQKQQYQQYSNQLAREQSSTSNQIGSPKNYPQSGQTTNDNYPQPSYSHNGLGNIPNYQTSSNQGQTSSQSNVGSYYPGSNIEQTQPQSGTSETQSQKLQPESNRNPKSYDDQPNQSVNKLSSPANAFIPQENSVPKPQLISAQMQIVDKNTDIHYKRPGEKEGLPDGLSKDDMSQLLYTFNYTVGFHGHFEEGYKNGAKVGYYYVTGRNGVRTRVDYVADEKGFRPKITQEVLDLLSDDVPKPDTEKDPKYGLKGYEFKWLYYPKDTK